MSEQDEVYDSTESAGEPDTDQLQPDDTLEDRGVEDALDEGFVTREGWSAGQGFGNTASEQLQGESLDQRLAQEEPEPDPYGDWSDDNAGGDEVGEERAGRLVAPDEGLREDRESRVLASDVGIDGAGASAEEAAVHVIPDPEL